MATVMKFGVGQSVVRKEDDRLTTGRGRYTDDLTLPGQAHAVLVRSPHAHARIRKVDIAAAKAHPGVLAVLTGADVAREKLGQLPPVAGVTNRDGSTSVAPDNPLLKADIVRHVGDPVALVVAESVAIARDAADLVVVDYAPLPAVTDIEAALAPGAPLVHADVPGNLCLDWGDGDSAKVEAAFAKAAKIAKVRLINNRLVVASMEARAALGSYDAKADRYTLVTNTQGVHAIRDIVAGQALKIEPDRLHVLTHDVGGGFGMKGVAYAEQVLVLWAAKKLGRPVKWASDRAEAFLTDTHGREHVSTAEMALDKEGRFLALRVFTVAGLGAYASSFGPLIPTLACQGMQTGVYAIPHAYVHVKGVFTHTVSVDAYRGAGRPEAAYLIERLVDVAAVECGLAPEEIRRRNFIAPSAMPYTTTLGLVFDSGEFARLMGEAMEKADWRGFAARRDEARRRGRRRGIGMAYYIETCAGPMLGGETARIRFEPNDEVVVLIGTQSTGQGHETAYAQVVAEALGLPFERITVRQGDSTDLPVGGGTGGSRSLMIGGMAMNRAAEDVIKKALPLASEKLEVAARDVEFRAGRFTVKGTDRSVGLGEIAAAARATLTRESDGKPGLEGSGRFDSEAATYPNGCHVCEVEIDSDTGALDVVRYTVVDDFGKVINPLLLAGQVHGGIAQGLGQALYEETVFDPGNGQLISGSFMDYCMPRADDFCRLDIEWREIPCRTNLMGIKGAGEAGAIGAPPAAVNAVVNALADLGVRHIDMPVTPSRLWRAINRPGGA